MRILPPAASVALGALLLLALAGCGLGATPSPSSHGSHHATAHPTASAAALTAPRSSLPLGCADVLPLATAVGAFPASSGIALRESQDSAPDGIFQVATKQAGGLHCVWGGTDREDNGYDDSIVFDEVGAAADLYHQSVVPNSGDEVNTFGTASTLNCDGDPQFSCFAQVLVGQRWFDLDYMSLGGEGEPSSGSLDRFHALLTGVVQRVQAAAADRTLWTPPTSGDGAHFCEDAALARVRTAWSLPDLVDGDGSIDGSYTASSVGLNRTGIQSCAWARSGDGVTNVQIQYVQGGAWALAQEQARPIVQYDGTLAPVTIAGATAAVAVCNGELCRADLAVGGGWMTVYADGGDSVTTLTHDVAALLAATPH